MSELNISSFIQTMQQGLVLNDTQEATGLLLLGAINEQEYVKEHGFYTDSLSSKKFSQLVKQTAPVPDGIKQASVIPEVINETIDYFREKVLPDLNPHLKEDTLDKIEKLVYDDPSISKAKQEALLTYRTSGDEAEFLAQVFLYAINRPYKKEKNDVLIEVEDATLLDEVNYECPLCHKKLIETVKGRPIKRYTITKIYPDNLDPAIADAFQLVHPMPSRLDALENLIALDERCAEEYSIDPTEEEYDVLFKLKQDVLRNYAVKTAISKFQLEENIRTVIEALSDWTPMQQMSQLNYEALRIDEKFEESNYILKSQTQFHVLTYYKYIESVFRNSDADFDMIASEVKICSQKLEKSGLSQGDVISELSKWIRQQAHFKSDFQLACNIVVSFFIQNCEVFYKDEDSK